MSSEDAYKDYSKPVRSLALSQLKTDLLDLAQSEQDLQLMIKDTPPSFREAKYTGKGVIKRLERMFATNADEI